ncbi:hypothetical protein COT29_04025 [Candidatus Micrarchaeota archaeon CG08_land_8_20_14_0_20_59_11]|nr:MAG: hypothetical protein COT29_04025 [Candidatus Micrarchaeota archaeon CG08_land_8_20_14_0_20_59_11]
MRKKNSEDAFEQMVSMKTVLLGGIAIVALFAAVLFMTSQPKPAVTAPTALSISISNGAPYTRSAEVFLKLSAIGAKDCAYSNDNAAWSAWEQFTDNEHWVLQSAEGMKTVYYKCRSASGGIAGTVSDTILFDATSPTVDVTAPVSGAVYPAPAVTLTFTPRDNLAYSLVCTAYLDGAGSNIGQVRSKQTHSADIVVSTGSHSLYVKCRDDAGNEGVSATKEFTVVPAQAPPTPTPQQGYSAPPANLYIAINNGAQTTDTTAVVLSLSAINATQCRYSNDGLSWTAWEPYLQSRAWVLASGNGVKSVHYQCQNDAGVSPTVYDTIKLDVPLVGTPPQSLSVSINNGARYVMGRNVGLTLSAIGASECRYNNDGNAYVDWEPYYTYRSWTLLSGDGVKTVYYQCRNSNGWSSPAWSTIFMDTVAPFSVTELTGSVESNAERTRVILVWYGVTDPQPGSNVNRYNVYRSDAAMPYSFEKIGETTDTRFTDESPSDSSGGSVSGFTRAYTVHAVDNAGNEGDGNVVVVTG